ncbi:MAG: hypothetical protein LBE50_00755 [Gallionellaceae bacterium]|jgi:hypothetical protein|nr:hypothetical protein [Gallionellaceae bacterium]
MISARKQRGAAGFVLLLLLMLALVALLPASPGRATVRAAHDRVSAQTLAHAKAALIGDAALQSPINEAAFLRLPDIGIGVGNAPAEGGAAPNFSGNIKDFSVIGKFPWRSLILEPQRDGNNECLWYAVSGRFKNTPLTDALNWDTPGQLTLLDADGNVLVERAAALVIVPGVLADNQQRARADAAYSQCGGNYDARNYLDPFNPAAATANYFPDASNGRVAASTTDKTFQLADGVRYNDAFLAVSSAELFQLVTHRADFAAQIAALLDEHDYFSAVAISGNKGTDSVNCNNLLNEDNKVFCKNWKEMLLLVQLPAPTPALLDGAPTPDNCARVLLFGGARAVTQIRNTTADKLQPANYLEGDNLTSFVGGDQFGGNATFDADHPDADLLRCLP